MVVKRVLDLAVASAALILLSPVLLVVALLILLKMGRPIFYRQTRPGFHEKPFTIYKFRTMQNLTGPDGRLLPDEKRLSPFGRFLRSTSLDELPELWNVFCGDMSLVGPRPLLMQYLPLYNTQQRRRHDVKPGLTGWAQIHGRNAVSWEERFKLDLWYVNHRNFFLDLKIIFITFLKTIRREGITAEGHATSPFFTGNAPSNDRSS